MVQYGVPYNERPDLGPDYAEMNVVSERHPNVDVFAFGAVGDGAADDTKPLIAAIARAEGLATTFSSMPGSALPTVVVPGGRVYRITDQITISEPIHFIAGAGAVFLLDEGAAHDGIVVSKGVGTAGIIYGGTYHFPTIIRPNDSGSGRANWSDASDGIRMSNVRNADIYVPGIYGFDHGFVPQGDEQGFAYNEVRIGRITNCQHHIEFRYLNTDAGVLGYVNENTFYGGKLELVSGAPSDLTGVIRMYMPDRDGSLSGPNNNVFVRTTLEGTSGKGVELGGHQNTFYNPRTEGLPAEAFHLTTNSRTNMVYGYDLDPKDAVYLDEGVGNRINGAWGDAGYSWSANGAVIQAANLRSDSRPAIGAQESGDTTDCSIALTGNGTVLWPASSVRIFQSSGSPEGVFTGPVGSLFLRQDGGAGTALYIKESGTGNTGWVRIGTVVDGLEIDGDLNHDGSNVGFYATTPVAQASAIGTQADLTDSSGGTADGTLAAISGSGADADINNNFADVAANLAAVNALVAAIVTALGASSGVGLTAD